MTGASLSVGQVSERTGLTTHTLRYYESAGLVPGEVTRDSAGRRRYSEADVTWFEVCSSLRRSGMPIATLRSYVALVEAGAGNETERLHILEQHHARLDEHLDQLRKAQALVEYKIEVYRSHLDQGTASELWSRPVGDG